MKIIIRRVDFWYQSTELIFNNLNLEIPLHSWIAVTGESGVGKSTLAKLLAGILTPKLGEIIYPPEFTAPGRLPIGFLYQNPDNQLVQLNVERELAFNLENCGTPVTEMNARVDQALDQWQLTTRRRAALTELSGGEKQRLALASLMITTPQLLILDEPTSNLDIFTRLELYRHIRQLYAQGVSIIWITQDEYELGLADRLLVLNGKEELSWN